MKDSNKCYRMSMVFSIGLVMAVIIGWAGINTGSIAFASSDKPIVLKFAEDEPAVSMYAKTRVWWANEIEKRTGGRLKIKIYPGGALARAPVMLDAVTLSDCPQRTWNRGPKSCELASRNAETSMITV